LRDTPSALEVVIFEKRVELGQGVAYSTPDPLHLLNVPACRMSAFPEDSRHFVDWAACNDDDFQPRFLYAEYLQFVLRQASFISSKKNRIIHVQQVVTNIGLSPNPWVVTCTGGYFDFDFIVLATGHDAPVVPRVIAEADIDKTKVVNDPWDQQALKVIGDDETVLVVGSGLTFVDVALSLHTRAPATIVHATSRHGLMPQSHDDPRNDRPPAPTWDPKTISLDKILRYVKGFGSEWRSGVDSLRPVTPELWQSFDSETKERFAEHLCRYWDVHRHRTAPGVGLILDDLLTSKRVHVHQAEVVSVVDSARGLHVDLDSGQSIEADHIVVCTGPSGDVRNNSLGRLLVARGYAQPGPLNWGYLVDAGTGALINGKSHADHRLLAIGPLRKGVLGESTAIPEIRQQAADIARTIAAAVERQRTA